MASTLRMSKTVPVREFRSHLAELLDEVADRRGPDEVAAGDVVLLEQVGNEHAA